MEENHRITIRGELALIVIVVINSLGVVLMLHSGAGISAISSVPYAFSDVWPKLSLGTWTYLFQGLLVLTLFVARKRIVLPYLLSFLVGFVFGEFVDFHEAWVNLLPQTMPLQVLYFVISYVLICIELRCPIGAVCPLSPRICFHGSWQM